MRTHGTHDLIGLNQKEDTVVPSKRKLHKKKIVIVSPLRVTIFLFMMFSLIGGVIVFAAYYPESAPALFIRGATLSYENKMLLRDLEELVTLPDDEMPEISRVTDPTLLSGIPFFQKAKIGDKVILYRKQDRVYLFDPIAKKILETSAVIGELPASPR